MIDRLTAKGVRVIGVQDGYDSARRGHKLQAGLSGIIGEAFREMVKDRTYAALESRAKAGRPTGGDSHADPPALPRGPDARTKTPCRSQLYADARTALRGCAKASRGCPAPKAR